MNRRITLAVCSAALACLAAQLTAAQAPAPAPAQTAPPASTPAEQPTESAPPAPPQSPPVSAPANGGSKSVTNERVKTCMAEQRANDPARTEADLRRYCESQLNVAPGS